MRSRRINWTQVRDDYIKGDESLAQLAVRHGIAQRSIVEHRACKRSANSQQTWTELRAEYRARISRETLRDAAKLSKENQTLRLSIANTMLKKLLDPVKLSKMSIGEIVQAAKLGIDPHLFVSGAGGGPIETSINVDGLSERQREAIGRVIDTVLRGQSHKRAAKGARQSQTVTVPDDLPAD